MMKIRIQNYRTVLNAEIDIKSNKLNYLLGANESGKSNILNGLRIPDLKHQENFVVFPFDRTIINSRATSDPIMVSFKKNEISNTFFSTGEISWLHENPTIKSQYLEIIEKEITSSNISRWKNELRDKKEWRNSNINSLRSEINDIRKKERHVRHLESNTMRMGKDIDERKLLKSKEWIYERNSNWRSINMEIRKKHKELLREETLYEENNKVYNLLDKIRGNSSFWNQEHRNLLSRHINEFNAINEQINVLEESAILNYPIIKYIEPIIKAKEKEEIKFHYRSLFQKESLLSNICHRFLSKETIADLVEDDQFENPENNFTWKRGLFKELNWEIKKYFQKLENVSFYPHFHTQESEVILDILPTIEHPKLEIDASDENQRSLGYKVFLRIIIELMGIKASNKKTLYIIDEPEQSLHPYLQEELIQKIEEALEENDKLTILLSTHSPYIIQKNEKFDMNNVSFVFRNKRGATEIKNGSKTNNLVEILKQGNNKTNSSRKQLKYLLKIIRDSKAWVKAEEKVNREIEEMEARLERQEMTSEDYLNYMQGEGSPWEFQELNVSVKKKKNS